MSGELNRLVPDPEPEDETKQPVQPLELRGRALAERVIEWGNKVISGDFSGHLSDYEMQETEGDPTIPKGGSNIGDGVVLDLNEQRFFESAREMLLDWMAQITGFEGDEAPLKYQLLSPDEETTVKIIDKDFGKPDDPFYLSQWQNVGEEPSFILWSKEMYEEQEEFGYTRVEDTP